MAVFSIATISKSLAEKALCFCPVRLRHATVLLSPPSGRHALATLARRTALARVNMCILFEPLGRVQCRLAVSREARQARRQWTALPTSSSCNIGTRNPSCI
eukprot:1673573-Pleurochrysis_carterae.AAC.1